MNLCSVTALLISFCSVVEGQRLSSSRCEGEMLLSVQAHLLFSAAVLHGHLSALLQKNSLMFAHSMKSVTLTLHHSQPAALTAAACKCGFNPSLFLSLCKRSMYLNFLLMNKQGKNKRIDSLKGFLANAQEINIFLKAAQLETLHQPLKRNVVAIKMRK